MTERRSPTVLVARRVTPGKEAAFAEWMARMIQAAQSADGHVASDVQRPDSTHPGEWMIVYRFESSDSLDVWLNSSVRQQLMEEGSDLITSPPREQVFAAVASDPGVRMVTSYLLKDGGEPTHREVHDDILAELDNYPGFRSREILEAVAGIQSETVVILTFDDEPSLRSWLESDERQQLLTRLDPHIEGTYTTNVLGGFAGWFTFEGSAEPPRWKQALVVLTALFPISLLITFIRSELWPNAPMVFAVFIGNVIGISILTWVVMPPLTRRLAGWLRR
jgi:antibiotic biosynthesis monooxygenase (ABM) superfamily enzyme